MIMKKNILSFIMVVISLNISCKKFLEINSPKDQASPIDMFSNDATATSAITGIYSRMAISGAFSGNQNSISSIAGLSADELRSHNTTLNPFFNNDVPTSNTRLWLELYTYIFTANAILEGLQTTPGVSMGMKDQLNGEAKFVRAICYFYLVNFYGEVPLVLNTDYRNTKSISKSSISVTYNQILDDLINAETLLSEEYITTERIRPNKWAAKALLSRVYLYLGNWNEAIQHATELINKKNIFELSSEIDNVFLKNSKEAIWQLMPTSGTNTKEGTLFILISTPTNVSLTTSLVNSFELGDNRRTKWISQFSNASGTYYFPFKYKIRSTSTGVINEYSMIIRLAEIYLIRAEALAQAENSVLALEDINLIRRRAGLTTPLQGLSKTQCLTEIGKQRRFELFTEFGHRWLDLKRTDKASEFLAPLKGSTWQETDVLYPIPETEIARNPNIKQNIGY
jgi:hypothetical protein